MADIPQGIVAFLFTDIVGSTRLWERHPEAMSAAIRRHDALLREIFEGAGGFVFKTVGDAFCVAFPTPGGALRGAAEAMCALAREDWGEVGEIAVRAGVHAGPAEFRGGDYFGPALNRAARIASAAHGGQVLVSGAAVELLRDETAAGIAFRDLGEHRLRGIERAEGLHQLLAEGLGESFPPPRTMELLPNNLPEQTSSFIGREREMAAVAEALGGKARLVTLTGAGGTGKTRLAIECSARLLGSYPGGVWLAELALASEPGKLVQAVSSSAGIREEPSQPLRETLIEALKRKTSLLLLDNCEHLAGAVAGLAAEILRACPGVRILATSRLPLGVPGEIVLPVPPLGILDLHRERLEGPGLAARVMRHDAVKLFVERAASIRPDFRVTEENARAVAEICARLDGIPLAIELAAARVRLLDPEQLAARLVDRFRLIRGGGAGRLPHQQTLEALIEWSYDLLSEPEKKLFRRLGVFAGGRSLEAIEAVCSGGGVEEYDILDLLQGLAEKSLVASERGEAGDARYTMLESVWAYARQKLREAGEEEGAAGRHGEFFLRLAERAAPEYLGANQKLWLDRFVDEAFNFDAAIRRTVERGEAGAAVRFLAALGRPFEVRGYLIDAGELAERVLSLRAAAPPELLPRAVAAAGRIAWANDRYEEASARIAEAERLAEAAGDGETADLCSALCGYFARGHGDREEAGRRFRRGLEASAASGDLRLRALSLSGLGRLAMDAGRQEEARDLLGESVSIYRGLGDRWTIGLTLWGVAQAAAKRGDIPRALEAVGEWAEITAALGNLWMFPYILAEFAEALCAGGDPLRAARFYAGAASARERFGIVFTPLEAEENAALVAAAREALSPEAFREAWEEGAAQDLETLLGEIREARPADFAR